VLVDSEELAWEAWRRALAAHGYRITNADIAHLTGRTESDAHEFFSARVELPPFEMAWEEISDVMFQLFDARLEAFEDAADTLEVLSCRGHRLAVASSSARDRVLRSLDAVGLRQHFEVFAGGDEVERGKPAPDLFLMAAERLGVNAVDCVAVEDSPSGVRAALDAGMYVVAVERGLFDAEELRAAHVVIPRLTPAPFLM
jgi:HAD superfamily hydrolase (TIGR01509 family)